MYQVNYKFDVLILMNQRKNNISSHRLAPNKVKVITNKDGRTVDYIRCQLANGDMVWKFKDNKSGLESEVYFEKFNFLDSIWKPVSIEGAEEFAKAMGKY